VVTNRRFGVSTRLYQSQRLNREHLAQIAAYGFDTVEVPAVRTHFDFGNPSVVSDLLQWLAEARLDLHGMHVPIGGAGPSTGLSAGDDAEQALFVARQIPMRVLTLQVARPKEAAREIDRLADAAAPLNVTVAIDSNSEGLSPASSLVHFVEGFDASVGVALDFGRAQRDGDVIDAIETVSEHLVSVHLPLESRIDWPSALTTVQKVGYEGPMIFDLTARGSSKELLQQARKARERFEKLLCTYI
jgi:sugar phosphate isomerase/epimerase